MKKKPKGKIEFDLTKKGADKININFTPFEKMTFAGQVKYFENYIENLRKFMNENFKRTKGEHNYGRGNIELEILRFEMIVTLMRKLNVKLKPAK